MELLHRYAQRLHDEVRCRTTAPGFVQRLECCMLEQHSDHAATRGPLQPRYLLDRAVRRWQDPAVFLKAHISLLNLSQPPARGAVLAALSDEPLETLCHAIDLTILLLGDYDVVWEAVQRRSSQIRSAHDYQLALMCGVLAAAVGATTCVPLLQSAKDGADNELEQFSAEHRLATAYIKRLDRAHDGLAVLAGMAERLDARATSGCLGAQDVAALRGVLQDLSVAADPTHQPTQYRSWPLYMAHSLTPWAVGYLVHQRCDLAGVVMQRGSPALAARMARECADLAAECNDANAVAALLAWANAAWLDGKWVQGAAVARRVSLRCASGASPTWLQQSRQIQASCLAALGDSDQSRQILADMDADPLGLRLLHLDQVQDLAEAVADSPSAESLQPREVKLVGSPGSRSECAIAAPQASGR